MDSFDFLHGVRGQQVERTDGVEFLKNDSIFLKFGIIGPKKARKLIYSGDIIVCTLFLLVFYGDHEF